MTISLFFLAIPYILLCITGATGQRRYMFAGILWFIIFAFICEIYV